MIELNIDTSGLKRMESALLQAVGEDTRRRAISTCLTRLAVAARAEVIERLPQVFDRPTPFTMHSPRYRAATDATLEASVYISDDSNRGLSPRKYLGPEIRGGVRDNKASERVLQDAGIMTPGQQWVPSTRLGLNQYGNVRGGLVTRILSRVGAFGEVGFTANATDRTRKRQAKARRAVASTGTDYFVARSKRGGEPLGIWQLVGKGQVRPVLIFANKRPTYSVRLPFHDIVREFASTRFRDEMVRALLEQIERGRR